MPPLSYYWGQLRQAWAKRHKDASFRLIPFIDHIIAATTLPYSASILCVGARNDTEVRLWAERGYHRVRAIDLLPGRGVEFGDMHRLRFVDDSFDLVFASHSLEHAWDAKTAMRELVRVLRRPAYLFAAFPIRFTPTAHDRYDYGSVESGFLAHLPPWRSYTILWRQVKPGEVAVLFRCD